ncbi:CynX/NimT family MFS transporter [Acinetobacter puyangensis]|uniref:MFS transporter n=1 Tax=Acinetobacter puyangensis TaxID=1096779 RepID=UPI003A4D5ED5
MENVAQKPLSKAYCWSVLVLFSLLFFLITAATFTSLGVVLPSMIEELGWSWTSAGFGFTLLGLACGLSSYVPAHTIRKFGVRITLLLGMVVLVAGFTSLYLVETITGYFIGTTLLGIGFSFVATVPGTFVLSRLFEKQSLIFGIYFTVGGLGGVIGPAIYFLSINVWHDWRMHWAICGIALLLTLIVSMFVIKENQAEKQHADLISSLKHDESKSNIYRSEQIWTASGALKTWQFYVIAAAYTSFLLCGITVNSFAVAHITDHGFAAAVAASLLSAQAFINAFSRVGGGILGEFIEPKKLLIISLTTILIGMIAISFANSWLMLMLFTVGIGVGYGMTFLSTSVLLTNYYGRAPYLELFSVMNLISTIACFGPLVAGMIKDSMGSFSSAFLLYAIIPFVILIIVILMKHPRQKEVSNTDISMATKI